MTELEKARANEEEMNRFNGRAQRRIARELDSQVDADDVGEAVSETAETIGSRAVLEDVRSVLRTMLLMMFASAGVIATIFGLVLVWPEAVTGARLYLALTAAATATMVAFWAALRVRSLHREDALFPAAIDVPQVEKAHRFRRVFGSVSRYDGMGLVLLGFVGATDAALAGAVMSGGMARSVPVIGVIASATVFAAVFVGALRWQVLQFGKYCGFIRARLLVRALSEIDFEKYPEKLADYEYAQTKLDPIAGHSFEKPKLRHYLVAGLYFLSIPSMFAILVAFRTLVANHEGALALELVVGISIFAAIFAAMAALLEGFGGHLLREEGIVQTKINRHLPSAEACVAWKEAHVRRTRQWANAVARGINAFRREIENDRDPRTVQKHLVVPRPYPVRAANDDEAGRRELAANDPVAAQAPPKEVA